MHQVMDVSGAVLQSEREYDIASNTNVTVGALVKLEKGLVVPVVSAETGAVLGITAEAHTGTEDALNPRNNGTKIIVRDAPGAVLACPAPVVDAISGSGATTVKFTATTGAGANAFDGGYIKDKTGAIRRITTGSESGGTVTLTVESGDTVAVGDKIVVYPPVGCDKLAVGDDGTNMVITKSGATSIKVVGRDEVTDEIWFMAVKHALGNGQ